MPVLGSHARYRIGSPSADRATTPNSSEAELKKRTLSTPYNTRPTWLVNAHAKLDRAVWGTCGWPEEEAPAEVLGRRAG